MSRFSPENLLRRSLPCICGCSESGTNADIYNGMVACLHSVRQNISVANCKKWEIWLESFFLSPALVPIEVLKPQVFKYSSILKICDHGKRCQKIRILIILDGWIKIKKGFKLNTMSRRYFEWRFANKMIPFYPKMNKKRSY